MKKVIVASHISDLAGPTEALERYLQAHYGYVDIILHPLPYCVDRHSLIRSYRKGKLVKDKKVFGQRLPNLATYFRDALLNVFYFFGFKARYDIFIGVDPLNCFIGLWLKRMGLVNEVYFYTIDWMPNRFGNKALNDLYHSVDRFCTLGCDAAWNLSPMISKVRLEQGLEEKKDILVPVGVEFDKINLPEKSGTAKSMVLLGALAPSKGPDLVLEALPTLFERFEDLTLYIIGRTPNERIEYGETYDLYEPKFEVFGERVKLLGRMDHDSVLEKLPHFDIGLALYKPSKDNLSAWADPSRVKDYLACGLPTIITDVPPIAKDIDQVNAGVVTQYTVDSFVEGVSRILSSAETFLSMRCNALEYMKNYNWKDIFDQAFSLSQQTKE